MIINTNLPIAIIGLGYVGLPLAIEFAKHQNVIGFDVNSVRISELRKGLDRTKEVLESDLLNISSLSFTTKPQDISKCKIFIVTVPTPVNEHNQPDLSHLIAACKTIGEMLKLEDIVIFESTVFPGCTEEICVPTLEKYSGLKFNSDFYVGYSPERINPGDKKRHLRDIKKIVSGSNAVITNFIEILYNKIIIAGTYKAKSIKVAEAAKVIENTQRDLNIALVNELAIIFNMLHINTEEVLEAAGTKWNFLPFRPGLVGGHCISVDPYYLTYKAQTLGYDPEVILAGRKLNNKMGTYIVSQLLKLLTKGGIKLGGAKVLIMGFSFKENCPDFRNTGVIDILRELIEFNIEVDIYDPWVNPRDVFDQFHFLPINKIKKNTYDAIILAVAHDIFREMSIGEVRSFGKKNSVLYDLKFIFKTEFSDLRL